MLVYNKQFTIRYAQYEYKSIVLHLYVCVNCNLTHTFVTLSGLIMHTLLLFYIKCILVTRQTDEDHKSYPNM